jgi:hypothetical protein
MTSDHLVVECVKRVMSTDKSTSEVLENLQAKGDHYTKLTIIERRRVQVCKEGGCMSKQHREEWRYVRTCMYVLSCVCAYSACDV